MGKQKVLVVGDVMLDHYTYVRTRRFAEEAKIPVWDEVRNEYRLGGAANVAHNLKALGGAELEVHLAGICGSTVVHHYLDKLGILHERICGHQTMTKRRFVDESGQIVFRHDNITQFYDDEVEFYSMMMNYWEQEFDIVIFSDYDKGSVSQDVVDIYSKCGKVVIVDSKREDLRIFSGSNVLKVNEQEYAAQVASRLYPDVATFFRHVVVTRGANGSDLIMSEEAKSVPLSSEKVVGQAYILHTEHFPAATVSKKDVKDVTGCGDTHTAAMAFSMLGKSDIRAAIRFANVCAADVVQKFGTSVPGFVV